MPQVHDRKRKVGVVSKAAVKGNHRQAHGGDSLRKTLQRRDNKIAQRITEIERKLTALDSQISGIVQLLSDPALYSDAVQSARAGQEYNRLSQDISMLTTEWEQLLTEAEEVKATLTESI